MSRLASTWSLTLPAKISLEPALPAQARIETAQARLELNLASLSFSSQAPDPFLGESDAQPLSLSSQPPGDEIRVERPPADRRPASATAPLLPPLGVIPTAQEPSPKTSFDWRAALNQSLLFLGFQHVFRMANEADTQAGLKGPFLKDYFATLRSLRGWDDGDPFFTNYVGHPMMGAISGFIQVHNDPAGNRLNVGFNRPYRDSRLKAFAWAAVYSLQFELGPFSEASIGNVGRTARKTSRHPMGYVDLVVTPVVGTSWLIGEDVVDRFVIAQIEELTGNHLLRVLARSFLNPTRSLANLLRFKKPWRRDTRQM